MVSFEFVHLEVSVHFLKHIFSCDVLLEAGGQNLECNLSHCLHMFYSEEERAEKH